MSDDRGSWQHPHCSWRNLRTRSSHDRNRARNRRVSNIGQHVHRSISPMARRPSGVSTFRLSLSGESAAGLSPSDFADQSIDRSMSKWTWLRNRTVAKDGKACTRRSCEDVEEEFPDCIGDIVETVEDAIGFEKAISILILRKTRRPCVLSLEQ